MKTKKPLFCRAGFLLPLEPGRPDVRIQDGYILSIGDRIQETGPFSKETGARILDTYGDKLNILGKHETSNPAWRFDEHFPQFKGVMIPAFVKAHGHDHEQPLIGIAKDEPLTSWLDHAVNPFTGFINTFQEKLSIELGCSPQLATYRMARVCDIHYGITASMVHHCNYNKYHVQEIAEANESAGTTMIVAIGGQDRNYVAELLDTPQQALERLERASGLQSMKRTRFCPGPDQVFSNSRHMLIPLKKWARDNNTLFHIHSSEEPATTRWFQKEIEPGMTPVEFADSIGILDSKSVLAHQVNCGPNDIEILARTGTRIVHNPLANTILGSGMPPVIEMMKAGIPVAISTDGSGSADNQNILAAARLTAQYQKAFHQDATLLKSQELLQMITSVPAGMLGFDQGSLSPGKLADWILIDLNQPNMVPTRLDNLMENLVWAADGSEIDSVISHGRILKQNGRVLPFLDGTNPSAIMETVQRLSELFAIHRTHAPELSGTGVHH